MIPSDVAARLQLTADAAITRVPSVQQVSDALADLVPGQRVLAEIQALLPTGAYRALINQRDVTLALPFSAKAGDTLELEVVDNEGKRTLAIVSRRGESAATPAGERPAVEITLSRTGNFIAGLLAGEGNGEGAPPAALNGNRPLSAQPPASAADLVPQLRQAIVQSGMFYESHQAQWVANRMPTAALLAEPQGRLSAALSGGSAAATAATPQAPATSPTTPPREPATPAPATSTPAAAASGAPAAATAVTAPVATMPAPVAADLVPLVQQQLDALATQTYVWQGQAWPGQTMRWEIEREERGEREPNDADSGRGAGSGDEKPWQTRLTLTMPDLGEVRATLRLNGGDVTLALSADDTAAATRLASGGDALRTQLSAAGLVLNGFTVGRHEMPRTAAGQQAESHEDEPRSPPPTAMRADGG